MPRARASVFGLGTDNKENRQNPNGCKFWKTCRWNADEVQMMTWQNATRKQMTWQRRQITGRHLAHRIRGVTTLHHYERISSRDLGLEKLRIFGTEVVLAFPGAFMVGMMWPLHFQEFDRLVASLALSFFKNSNGVLMIRQVFLEINLFEVDGAVRSLETQAKHIRIWIWQTCWLNFSHTQNIITP